MNMPSETEVNKFSELALMLNASYVGETYWLICTRTHENMETDK